MVLSRASRLLLVAFLGVAGSSQTTQAQSGARPVPFKVGESLTYDISWSTFMSAGSATVSVKERRQINATTAAYDVVAEGRPSGFLDALYHAYYKAESLLDTRTLQPSIATLYADEGGKRQMRTTRFVDRVTIDLEPEANAPHEKHVVPEMSVDTLTAFYAVRAFTFTPGGIIPMAVVDGTDIYKMRWQVAGPEPITTAMGAMSAWRITSALSDEQNKPLTNKRVSIWISNDARKLPLKFEVALPIGNFVLTLTKATG